MRACAFLRVFRQWQSIRLQFEGCFWRSFYFTFKEVYFYIVFFFAHLKESVNYFKFERIKRSIRYLMYRLFPRRQNPHRLSLAIALGVFIALLPSLGLALFITVFLCAVFRLPKIPACVASFVGTPPTLIFFFWPISYKVGLFVLPKQTKNIDLVHKMASLNLNNFSDEMGLIWSQSQVHLWAFLLGTFIVSSVFAVLSYVGSRLYLARLQKKTM